MNPLNWLPTLFEYFENLCIKIAAKGWHRPGFYLSTLFTAPVALYVHKKETRHTGLNVILKIMANVLLLLALFFLLRLWIFLLLLPLARIVKFVYDRLRIGEPEVKSIEWKQATAVQKEEELFYRPNLTFKLEKLDLLALLFILFVFLGFAVNAGKFNPTGPDCWYHMATARKIIELGTVPMWDTWEFQPVGRPHLYPPLIHILIAVCSGGDPENIIGGARILQIVLYPAALLASWYFARLLFSSKVAFIALVILSMDATFSIIFVGLMPSSLVNLFFPLILIGFLSKRLLLSVPLPAVAFNVPKGGPPIIPSITALDGVLGLQFWSSSLYEEDMQLKQLIEQYTSPDQIIHVDEAFLADKIVTLTGRPVDNGMWFEVGSEEIQRAVEYSRLHDRPAVFVYLSKERLPSVDEIYQIGRYWIALRV